jgi:hypothetical protein
MSGRRIAAVSAVLGILLAVGAFQAIQHGWPFSKASISAQANGGSSRWTGAREDPIRPAEEIWSGEVSLALNHHYGLNEKTVTAPEPCPGCLMLTRNSGGGLLLHAENGILPWPKRERPSYLDCIHQRESGTLDSVSLAVSPHDSGLPVHSWICATGRDDDIVRLQYQGQGQSGNAYLFAVTAWHRPFGKGKEATHG